MPHTLAKATGDAQTGPAGDELATTVSVRISDAFGTPVAGVGVTWSAPTGSGAPNPGTSTTDAQGLASTRWTLGPTKGTHTLRATSGSLAGSPATFSATATPNGRISGQVTMSDGAPAIAMQRGLATLRAMPGVHAAGASSGRGERPDLLPARWELPSSPNESQQRFGPMGTASGSLIVRFRPNALQASPPRVTSLRAPGAARLLAGEMRAKLEQTARTARFTIAGTSPAIRAARIRVEPAEAASVRAELLRNPGVLAVESEAMMYALESPELGRAAAAPRTANDPAYNPQAWHYAAIDAPEAWALTTGSPGVLVAVVDDGIRFDHPALAANLTNDGYDFASRRTVTICGVQRDAAGDDSGYDPDPTNPAGYDCSTGGLSRLGGHGLHVAGTIGAVGNDGIGTTGVNWSVRVRPIRALGVDGAGFDYDIAQGILYAAGLPADDGAGGHVQAPSGARIINLSLGGADDSPSMRDAVRAATAAGVLVVAAAGNTGSSRAHYPSAYPEVLSVSAVGPDLQLASYSSFGPTVDLAAPGGDFADGGASFGVASTVWDFEAAQPAYAYYHGTSMAAPHVSGVAALILAAEPGLSVEQLRERLTSFAVDLGPLGTDESYGAGLVNARNALTRTLAPPRTVHAALYDAQTGARIRTTPVGADATYTFTGLDDGTYFVFAGEVEDGDAAPGVAGRRWGSFGSGASRPTIVTVAGAGLYPAPVAAGVPGESEPNDTQDAAARLVVGGYLSGEITSTSDSDYFTITVPAGQYVFETSPADGACGFALESDTMLQLFRADGSAVETSHNIAVGNLCSRVTRTLTAGTYYLRVAGVTLGRYRIAARAGAS